MNIHSLNHFVPADPLLRQALIRSACAEMLVELGRLSEHRDDTLSLNTHYPEYVELHTQWNEVITTRIVNSIKHLDAYLLLLNRCSDNS